MGKKRKIKEEHNDIRTFALPSVAPLMLTLVAMFSGKTRLPRIIQKNDPTEVELLENMIPTDQELVRDSTGALVPDSRPQLILSDTPIVYATGKLEEGSHLISEENLAVNIHKTFGAEGLRHFLALVVFLEENSRTGHFSWNVNRVLTEMGYQRDPGGSFNIELKKKATNILFLLTNLIIVARRKSPDREEIKLQKLFHMDGRHLITNANGILSDTINIQASSYWYQDSFFQDGKNRKGKQYTKLLRKIITENHWKHSTAIYLSTLLSIFWRISRGKPRTFSIRNLANWCNLDIQDPNGGYHWAKLLDELAYMKDRDYLGDFKVRKLRSYGKFSLNDRIDFYPPTWLNEEFDRIRNKQEQIIQSYTGESLQNPMELAEFREFAEKLGLSNRELAKQLGISHSMVNMLLAGKRKITFAVGSRLRLLLSNAASAENLP